MTETANHPKPQRRENPEPHEDRRPVPYVMLVLIALLVMWALAYLALARPDADPALGDRRSPTGLAGATAAAAGAPDGAQLYASHCQACHQATGMGVPQVFPPLAGSEWVKGDEQVLLQIPLHGIAGPLEVSGQTFNGAMPAFGGQLDDAELAALVSYIRSQWGNGAAPVDAAAVAQARALGGDRTAPWNGGAELQQFRQSLPGK